MKEVREERDDSRKNVIVLTIIAIATMIVVLVGATFAYLASQVASNDTANIEAATNAGNDMLLINAGGDMEINANTENFFSGAGNRSDNTEATVTLQSSSSSQVTYTYNAYLSVTANDFEYTSGACYRLATEVAGVTESQCTANNNSWANTANGYKCYSGTFEAVEGSFSNNEVGCLTDAGNMWVPEEAAELVIDLYKVDDTYTTQGTCEVTGVCVDNMHAIVSGISAESNCTGTNTWISSKFQNSMCYVPIVTEDLTTTTANTDVQLVNNASISVTNSTTTDRYYVEVTLINFDHNQIVNGNKTFSGQLTFERVTS